MLLIFLLFSVIYCETYALLLSGIGPWGNLGYASEASIYQSYYYLVHGGIKRENIILFSMDSIAYNPQNPFPGEIYAYEGGPNVYEEVKNHIDYRDYENSPKNFKKVLLGEDMHGIGSGRSLENMTEEDDLFIVSMNHGETGMMFFHYDNSSVPFEEIFLWGSEVIETIKKMKSQKRFRKLVWFLCSCYGGSSFAGQLEDIDNVFVATAGPATSSTLACDVSGKIGVPIGCCFHQNWQAYLRENYKEDKTIMDQFLEIYKQKINYGAELTEEYCFYGSQNLAKKTKMIDMEGSPEKTFSKIYSTRKLDIIENSVMSMKDVRNGKISVDERPSPYPGYIQLEYEGFDLNYQNCNVRTKINLECTRSIYEKIFKSGSKSLIQCSQQETVLDFVKNACSDGVKANADEIYNIIVQHPCTS